MYRFRYGETPKLTSANYFTWRTDIEDFLRTENALGIVRGNEAPPPAGNTQAAVKATQRYKARVGKAYGIIVSSCSLLIKTYIENMEDPAEI
jgi:hypothetical protein